MSRKRNIWRGLTTLTASLLTVSVAAGPVVDSYRTDIDKFLGTKSSAMVTDSTDEDLYTHKSDYSSTTELLDSIEDLGERMSEERTRIMHFRCQKMRHRNCPFLDFPATIRYRVETWEAP
mgnify:CR=1 FL=1